MPGGPPPSKAMVPHGLRFAIDWIMKARLGIRMAVTVPKILVPVVRATIVVCKAVVDIRPAWEIHVQIPEAMTNHILCERSNIL